MPGKADYGDVDFLVSGFQLASLTAHGWKQMVAKVKEAFHTPHGKRGFLNPDIMYFAIQVPDKDNTWVQIDVKVTNAQDVNDFAWDQFQLNYASGLKIMGSLMKPLGLTISPTGLHVRVEDMEATDFPGSLVFVTKQPADVLKILRLDKRFLKNGFVSVEESKCLRKSRTLIYKLTIAVYHYFASTWIFNPAHYAARLEEDKYRDRIEDRAAPWVYFLTEWIPKHYPDYCLIDNNASLEEWRKQTRAAIREKVFTMFPSITLEFYTKRSIHLKEVEENRLKQLLMSAIPGGHEGWDDDIPKPTVITRNFPQSHAAFEPTIVRKVASGNEMLFNSNLASYSQAPIDDTFERPLTPPDTPPSSVTSLDFTAPTAEFSHKPLSTPLYLQALPRTPPLAFTAHPPQKGMSVEAKLTCLARWTNFDPQTGNLYLACEPREKKFEMCWSDSGASDEVLVRWMKEMWWVVWVRQTHVNYVGMWMKRFEKEDVKAEKNRLRDLEGEEKEDIQVEVEARRAKIMARLEMLNGC